ncbi:HNH endonuclease signature motif containing protein [Gordonia sinesedis]
MAPDPASTDDGGVEQVLRQLAEDTKLYAPELVEVLVHAQAVRSSADFRMLQAASLIHEEREAEYLARVTREAGSGEIVTAADALAVVKASVDGDDPRAKFGPDGLATAVCEVGAALTIPPGRARQFIEAGTVMRYQLPKVGQMLAIGRIDLTRFLAVVARTALIDEADMTALDDALADEIAAREPMSMTRFTTMVDATIAAVDADALRRRRERVDADRHITIGPDRRTPGQASVSGTLPSDHAAGVDARLSAMADELHAGDPRSRRQRRADALVTLARGEQHLVCGCDDCTASGSARTLADGAERRPPADMAVPEADVRGAAHDGSADSGALPSSAKPSGAREYAPRPTFHIVVNLSTLLGADSDPAFLDGHGVIDADTARRLLAEARRSYVHPDHSAAVRESRAAETAEHRYAIAARLRGLVAAGELCCSFPGCTNPVHDADLDHTDAFDHANPARGGPTSKQNLKPLCRFHHRHKTFAVGWRDYQTPLGSVYFQSPTRHIFAGNAYTGRDLFTALAGRDPPSDHPGRHRIDRLRAQRAETIRRADKRAEDRWNNANPIPF